MGVCKCKQRNVTNQFCYVCRMNVCESCIVKDHQRCIIKSYVHWLQDSDYNAICLLCMESISTGEVVRLTCYDIFHWDCFNAWALKKCENTPPSGYQCPDCKAPVFPPPALVSPVADVIRQKFSSVAWGRRCLGLPPQQLQQSHSPQIAAKDHPKLPITPALNISPTATSTPKSNFKAATQSTKVPFVPLKQPKLPVPDLPKNVTTEQEQVRPQPSQVQPQKQPQQHAATYVREKFQNEVVTPHKVIDSRRYDDAKINVSFDHDDNKYKRKGFTHWFGNLLSLNKKSPKRKEGAFTFKRLFILLVLLAMAFMTGLYLMSSYGRSFAASDPLLDPLKNPNIKLGAQEGIVTS